MLSCKLGYGMYLYTLKSKTRLWSVVCCAQESTIDATLTSEIMHTMHADGQEIRDEMC